MATTMTKKEAAARLRVIARALRYGDPESETANELDEIADGLEK